MIMNYYSIERSMEIAKERGEKYQDFEQSDYANGKYFEFYTSQEFEPKFEKVRQLFDGIDIPTSNDWKELQNKVEQYGLYHAYRLAIAPTQSIFMFKMRQVLLCLLLTKLNVVRMEMRKHFIQCHFYHQKQCGITNQHLILIK